MPDGLNRPPPPILLTTDAVGGIWRYSLDLARGLPGAVVAVLGPASSALQRDEAASFGVRLIETGLALDWIAEDAATLTGVTEALQRLAEQLGCRSVHLHAPALAGARRWSVPVVAVAHSCVATWWAAMRSGPLPADFAWRAAATRAGLVMADAVIAPTQAHADATIRAYGDVPIAVVHNGASPSLLHPLTPAGEGRGEGGATCGQLGFSEPTPLIPASSRQRDKEFAVFTAGRLWDEGKNAAALDRAAAALDAPIHAAGPITGPNGAHASLPNLRLLGTLGPAAMQSAYAEADVFASLARYEPFGLSVLEAAHAGCRLVLSDIPSFRELWDGVAHFVPLDADPVPALQAALAEQDDGGAAERAGRYTLERMVAGTLDVHRRVRIPA